MNNLTPKQVEVLLENIRDISLMRRAMKCVKKIEDAEYDSIFSNVYELPCEDGNLYLKLDLELDSYESNELVMGIQLVTPKVVEVIEYE